MAELTTVAHLSDLHFGRHVVAVVDSLLAELHRREPDAIVISGDFTQRAQHREFVAAIEFIRRLPVPPIAIPGNHDLVAWNLARRAVTPLHRYKRYISADLQPAWEDERLSILGVDTTRRGGLYLDWSRGAISWRGLRSICRHFAPIDSRKVKVLVTHQPFAQKPAVLKQRRLIDTPPGCLAALAACGVELILSGHFHHAHHETLTLRDGTRICSAQAGTGTSTRLKGEPNSFNWITVTPSVAPRFQIETLCLREDLTWAPDARDSPALE